MKPSSSSPSPLPLLSLFLPLSSPVLQTHIIELALQEGKRFLHEGEHALAIPAALEALKFLTELHGGTHIQLTPAYLILAEAAIGQCVHTLVSLVSVYTHTHTHTHTHTGLGRLAEADQYLSQAQWSVLKSPDCDPWLRSQLHRNLGQLAAAKNSFTEARKHFAEDVSSLSACLYMSDGLKYVYIAEHIQSV